MLTDTVHGGQFDVVARLLEPEGLADSGPFYAWLRDYLPVHRHPRGFYVLSRYRDTRWVFETPCCEPRSWPTTGSGTPA